MLEQKLQTEIDNLVEKVKNNYYNNHKQGMELLNIDVDKIIDVVREQEQENYDELFPCEDCA